MRRIKLSSEEKKIIAAIEQDEFVPVTGKERREVVDAIAARKRREQARRSKV